MNISSINNTSPWVSAEESTTNSTINVAVIAAYVINFLYGLPINVCVLCIMLRKGQKWRVSDIFPFNQLLNEMLFSFNGILYLMKNFLSMYYLLNNIFLFFSQIFLLFRPLVQSYICLEQYFATVHPVTFLRLKPLRYRVTCCCVSWLTVSVVSLIGLFRFNIVYLSMLAALYVSLLLLKVFSGISVVKALKRPGPGEGPKDEHRGNKMKRRAFIVILVNLMTSSVSQLPFVFMIGLKGTSLDSYYKAVSSLNTWGFVLTNVVPSFLYLYRLKTQSKK